jgi:mono/diheme cytochrome c family protein
MRRMAVFMAGCLAGWTVTDTFAGVQMGSSPTPQASPGPTTGVDYIKQVKPVLMKHCASCHGAKKPRNGLRLDSAAAALKGGDGGPVIVPGRSGESELVASIRGDGSTDRMPLNRPPLSPAEIDLLARWIDEGARHPAAELAAELSATPDTHWAFVPPRRVSPPATLHPEWSRNPIDAFILSRLEKEGLAPSEPSDRATLLRRVSLDLIGLTPSPAEIAGFPADREPGAYERLVDRLLGSPEFGVRWAHAWLDAARYADSNGYSIDGPRSIWKYRDWVVDALNADYPFDQFTIDQIAGDLRPGATLARQVATGFQRSTPINEEGGIDREQFRVDSVMDRVNTTGTVFLGLTIGCAQCHDHKFDPISQREYYRLFAFFNNVDEPTLSVNPPEFEAERARARERVDSFLAELPVRVPGLLGFERDWEAALPAAVKKRQPAEIKAALDTPSQQRTRSQTHLIYELLLKNGKNPAFKTEHDRLVALESRVPRPVTTMVVRERTENPRKSHVYLGGDFTRNGEEVTAGVPAVLPRLANNEQASPGSSRTDRLALARWLVEGRNPLTARVTVNRIWQAYFGRGLVETDNDFGTQGTPPSHPELLDWLACEFMERGWSTKTIHRLIVTSATYCQSSRVRADGAAKDPDNRFLWRQARLRLDAELIRDSALAASSMLCDRLGGPSVFPPQPDGVLSLGQVRREWRTDRGPDRYRRSLYTYLWRATPYAFFTTFDAPSRTQTCTRRLRSDTPLQALALLNDETFIEIARALAARIMADLPQSATDRARIEYVFLLCLGRAPAGPELQTIEQVLEQERREDPWPEVSDRGLGRAAHDEHASVTDRSVASDQPGESARLRAWTTVARVLLNLDEFVTRE